LRRNPPKLRSYKLAGFVLKCLSTALCSILWSLLTRCWWTEKSVAAGNFRLSTCECGANYRL